MKTMMKRSLALGALMAFVITGSAFAEDLYDKNLNVNTTESITHNGSYGQAGTVNAGALTITSDKANGNGIYAIGAMDVKLTGDLTIKSKANCIFVGTEKQGVKPETKVNVSAKNIYLNGRSWGIAPKSGTLTVKAEENIVINTANGITNYSGGALKVAAKNLIINADHKYGIIAGSAAEGKNDVNLNVANDVIVKLNPSDKTGGVLVSNGSSLKIENGGKTVVEGVVVANGGSIDVGFKGEGSRLTGTVTTADGAKTELAFNDGAKWEVTGDSKVTTLEGNSANIVMSNTDTKVEVLDNKNTGVNVQSTGALSDANAKDVKGMMDDLAKNVTLGGTVTEKTVTAGEGKVVGETTAQYKGNQMVAGSLKEKVNTVNAELSQAGAIGLMTWRNEMNDMNKRLGELRDSNGEHGVWVRMVNGELEHEGLENEYKTYQLGYDEKLSTDPRWTVGVAMSYTEGDTSGEKVSGENDHKGLAVYGSKLNDDGSYIDIIAKYARLDHEFTVRGGEKGEWDANGYSLSAEYGKRFTQDNGLWYEPQVELTYGTVGSADYVVDGRFVDQDKMDSLVGRVGFRIGKDTAKGNVYARASYLYDFDGETSATFSDGKNAVRTIEQDLGGGWFEVGVGANYKLSDATNLYVDVEKTFGGEVDTNWQWNAGVRYSF